MYSRLKKLYAKSGLRVNIYNFFRFKTCPFISIMKFIPEEGMVVDEGCGTGIFLNLLSLEQGNRLLLGLDHDARKIKAASESVNGRKNIRFEKTDIARAFSNLPEKPVCITLIDILCYLDSSEKREFLKHCSEALDPQGVLIIKDIEKRMGPKFFLLLLQELFMLKIFHLTQAKGLYWGNKETYTFLLKEAGFYPKVFDLSQGYFYPHILFVCQRALND